MYPSVISQTVSKVWCDINKQVYKREGVRHFPNNKKLIVLYFVFSQQIINQHLINILFFRPYN